MSVDNSFCSSVAFAGARSPTGSISSNGSADYDVAALSPTQLLALAIKKRRFLLEDRQRDYQRELLHSHLIQNLCKFLGEGRARVRRHRRSTSRRKLARRCRWDDDAASGGGASGGDERERRDQVVPDGSRSPSSSPLPTGLAFESTVQSEVGFGGCGGGDGGATARRGRRLWRDDCCGAAAAAHSDSEEDDDSRPPQAKRRNRMGNNRSVSDDDQFTLIDLDDKREGGGRLDDLREHKIEMFKHCTQIRSFATRRPTTFYDMVIVGGGLVGNAMACSIGTDPVLSSTTKVLLLESGRRPVAKRTNDETGSTHTYSNRVSAVNPSSVEMFKTFGVWDEICSKRVHPVSALYVEDGCAPSKVHFKQLDAHSPIAHIVENERVVSALHRCIKERCANVDLLEGAVVDSNLSVPENLGANVTIELDDGTVETSLLIAADGSKSAARKRAGIEYEETAYDQQAIVGTLVVQHNSESEQSYAWQRFMPTGPVALLPLGPQLCSLVWTVPTAEAARLLQLSSEHFVEELNGTLSSSNSSSLTTAHSFPSSAALLAKSLDCLGKALSFLPSKESSARRPFPCVVSLLPDTDDRAAFPLSLGYARDYVRHRVALIGDAAHRVHPLAGQGVNLGWSDVRFLTAALRRAFDEGGDFGSLICLRDFDTACQRRNVPILFTIDCLNRLYSTDRECYVFLRSVGFNILDRFLPAKDLIVHLAS